MPTPRFHYDDLGHLVYRLYKQGFSDNQKRIILDSTQMTWDQFRRWINKYQEYIPLGKDK